MPTAISPTVDREAWLQERLSGIGSSEAATACGLSPWESPASLYLRKIGEAEPIEESEAMVWGNRLEPLIADAYTERTGFAFADEQWFTRSKAFPFMLATIDRVRSDGRVVELKTVGARQASEWGESGTDEIPRWYTVQVLHQLAVTDSDVADVAALICGQELRVYTIERDDDVINALIDRECEFWNRVITRNPPAIDLERDARLLTKLFPRAVGEIEFDEETSLKAEEWDAIRRALTESNKAKDRLQAEILAALGNAGSARLSNGRVLTRKLVHVAERVQTVRAYDYARLSFAKGSSDE